MGCILGRMDERAGMADLAVARMHRSHIDTNPHARPRLRMATVITARLPTAGPALTIVSGTVPHGVNIRHQQPQPVLRPQLRY